MSKVDVIDKDTLEQLYIKEGKCYREIADMFNTDYYTIRNASQKYGLAKKKGGSSLRKESSKRGTQYKYGVDNVFQLESVKEKIQQTCLERYGVDHHFKNPEIYAKATQTAGDHNREKYKQTMMKKYGVMYSTLLPQCKPPHTCYTKINNELADYLDSLRIEYEREFNLVNYCYDFKIRDYLIELNPFPTHNSTWGLYNNPKDKYYHYNKSKCAKENGYVCVHIWDWEDMYSIIDALLSNKLLIGEQTEPNKFIFNTKLLKVVDINNDRELVEHEIIIYDSGELKIVV